MRCCNGGRQTADDGPRTNNRNTNNGNKKFIGGVYHRLLTVYDEPVWKRSRPAIDELILTVLTQHTNDRNSHEAFRRLKKAFPTWEQAERAPVSKVAEAIKISGLSNIKSKRIQEILRGIREEHGGYSLEFLKDWPPAKANEYLRSIPGVGPKTAACVLVFSCGMPVFPVDTHILRVTKRLGIVEEKATADQAHEILGKLVPDALVYPFHILLIQHGRNTCHARNPACKECVLLPVCPAGKILTHHRDTESTEKGKHPRNGKRRVSRKDARAQGLRQSRKDKNKA